MIDRLFQYIGKRKWRRPPRVGGWTRVIGILVFAVVLVAGAWTLVTGVWQAGWLGELATGKDAVSDQWAVNQATAVEVITASDMAGGMETENVIVIDSGHGFFDAGKIGVNGAEEKTINLAIACKVQADLKRYGYETLMTREDDATLYDGTTPVSKQEDMKKRVALINESGCCLAVSIHQNSFTQAKYKGAQVFYYETSEAGHQLATCIQKAFVEKVDGENTRIEKSNSDYYLLKKSNVPMVICECGFLSNAEEAALLVTDDYQEKAAWAITYGIIDYLHQGK